LVERIDKVGYNLGNMKIIVQAVGFKLNKAISDFIDEKMSDLERALGGANSESVEARVEIGKPSEHHKKGDVFYAEVNLKMPGKLLRATSENWDLRLAITEVKDELQRQIRKYKNKMVAKTRRPRKKENEYTY
jgi:putative sigma-54 modulation protein